MQSELVDGSVILKYPISDYLSKKQRKNSYFIRISKTLKLTAFKQQLKDKSAKHWEKSEENYFLLHFQHFKKKIIMSLRRSREIKIGRPVNPRSTFVSF